MSLGTILYRILIGPLELFFEVVFVIANRHVDNPAYAIIFLSLAMNFLVLPLYRRADAVQAEERDRENALAPWIKHIKKTFKGDERFMMLQAYYRENNYKPTDSLKGAISLLLEIPFFIAAYHFLSHLQTIKGVSFGPIADLGAPDALLTIGPVTLNLLPILMTLINVISAAIYLKGFPLKSKIQMYGIAAIFLVFLYNSPAGLVFYWTLNNLFSLIKNIFYKLPDPGKVLKVLCSAAGAILLVLVIFVHPMPNRRIQAIVIAGLLCMQIPILPKRELRFLDKIDKKEADFIFYASCTFVTLITGLLIPSAVIGDSAVEFISIANWYSPYWYIVSALTIAFGTFFVWFGIFYHLASENGRKIFSLLMTVAAVAATIDYMFFGKNYGNMSSTLTYDVQPEIGMKRMLVNAAVLMIAAAIAAFVFIKRTGVIKAVSVAMCLALLVMSGINIANIHIALTKSAPAIKAANESEPEISLSKSGKNVVVIMMDRQIGHYIPFIMHEKPELKKSFSGFINYSNSFSYGNCTNVGSPGLYGGYDYIPAEMNRRKDKKLVEKHDEALKVMPRIFSDAGYEVTVFDPSYAGYSYVPDLSIYDDMPNVRKCITMGKFTLDELQYGTSDESSKQIRMRNFFLYGIFKTSPQLFQPTIYASGSYNSAEGDNNKWQQIVISDTEASGMDELFLRSYAVISHLADITNIEKDAKPNFLMMSNDLTHYPMLLQEPSYTPEEHVDNSAIGRSYTEKKDDDGNTMILEDRFSLIHYQTNVAAMLKLGEWLDYLKKNGVYDNTRIIIVSDHGKEVTDNLVPVITYTNDKGEEKEMQVARFDCVLLVKDFNAESFRTNGELSSNADVPAMATRGIVDEPQNPYTGNDLGLLKDQKGKPEVIFTFDWQTDTNNGNTFLPADWFAVEDNIYDAEKWEYLGWR